MATRLVLPFSDVGSGIKPSDGAQLFFSDTGLPFSSDPRDTYTDSGAGTPNSNPVIADSNGLFPEIYLSGSYRVVLKDKNNVQIWSADDVTEFATNSSASMTYNQGLTGAVDRSVENRLQDAVSFLDWGAKFDGSTEDRAAINAAVTDVSAAGGGIIICPPGTAMMGKDGVNNYSILMPSNVTIIGAGEGVTVFKASVADSDYQIFRCGGTHGTRENIHFRHLSGDMNITVTAVDNGAEFIRFSNCINFSANSITVEGANGASVRADGYGAAGSNNDWYKSAPNYATDWGQSSNFSLNNITSNNCYLGVEIEGGAKEGTVLDGNHTNVVKFGVRLTSADTVTAARNTTDGCEVGVWIDRSYNCHIDYNNTFNYTQHAITPAFLQGGSISHNEDDGSGVLGTNHCINDSFQYVEADYTSIGLGAGSLRDVNVVHNTSSNRFFGQHLGDDSGRKVIVDDNFCGIDVIRSQNGRVVLGDNHGSLVESDLDYNSVRNGERHKLLTLTGISGSFTVGEIVTGGTSTATGKVVTFSGSKLHIRVRVGTFAAAEVVTGGTSGATGTIDTISVAKVLVTRQTNSDDTVSRFSMSPGPSPTILVNFEGNGTGDQALLDSFLCNRVERLSTGVYKVYFDRTMLAETVMPFIVSNNGISNRYDTPNPNDVTVRLFTSAGSAIDASRVGVIIFGELDT